MLISNLQLSDDKFHNFSRSRAAASKDRTRRKRKKNVPFFKFIFQKALRELKSSVVAGISTKPVKSFTHSKE